MKDKIFKNSAIVLSCSILAKLLSYVWEAIIAALYGVSDDADAFYMMTSVYNILFPILDLGIWKVFLPIYKTNLSKNDSDKADKVADIAITFFFIMSLGLVLFFLVFAKYSVVLTAPGFSDAQIAKTASYIRIAAPTYLLMAITSVISAMLQCHGKFLGSQLREIGSHISKIAYLLICYRFLGIYALVTAYIFGSVFRLLIQLPFIDWKWKFKWNHNFKDESIVPMIKGLPSVAITAAIAQINGFVDKVLASLAETGAVSCMNYGHKLVNVFSGMISTAIGTATYPTIVGYIAEKKDDELKKIIVNTVNVLSFIILPISLFCVVWAKDIVTVAFQRGAFDSSATELTARVFTGYAIGMFTAGVTTIVTNVFYGFGDTRLTMRISILEIGINIVLNLIFFHYWGIAGLALATSVSSAICLVVRFGFLKKFVRIDYRSIVMDLIKIIAASAVAVVCAYFVCRLLGNSAPIVRLAVSVFVIAAVYLPLTFGLKIQSISLVKQLLRKRTAQSKTSA